MPLYMSHVFPSRGVRPDSPRQRLYIHHCQTSHKRRQQCNGPDNDNQAHAVGMQQRLNIICIESPKLVTSRSPAPCDETLAEAEAHDNLHVKMASFSGG